MVWTQVKTAERGSNASINNDRVRLWLDRVWPWSGLVIEMELECAHQKSLKDLSFECSASKYHSGLWLNTLPKKAPVMCRIVCMRLALRAGGRIRG